MQHAPTPPLPSSSWTAYCTYFSFLMPSQHGKVGRVSGTDWPHLHFPPSATDHVRGHLALCSCPTPVAQMLGSHTDHSIFPLASRLRLSIAAIIPLIGESHVFTNQDSPEGVNNACLLARPSVLPRTPVGGSVVLNRRSTNRDEALAPPR
jgi:hypothetical protein